MPVTYIPHVETKELPDEYRYLLTENAAGELNLFKTVANNPPVLQSYMRWGSLLWEESGLTRREVEVVILSVARHRGSHYEWHQHVPLAREVGLADETIRAIADDNRDKLTDRQDALVTYAKAFLDGEVDSALHDMMGAAFDDGTVVGITMLCSHYLATAAIVEALGVEPEGSFIGWHLKGGD